MVRLSCGWLLVGLLCLTGCTRTEDYLEVARAQQQAIEEVTGILKKVRTAEDMSAARDALDERLSEFNRIARRARELPKPPPPEVERQIDRTAFTRAFDDLQTEVQRVKGLPGGTDFFRQWDGQGLLFSHAD